MPVTELDRANLIFERIMYQGPVRQAPEREERPDSSPEEARQERSPDRDRQDPQTERDGPQESPLEGRRPEQTPRRELPDDPWEIEPPKKDRGYRDKSTKRYGWEVVAVTDPNILGLVDLTR